MQVNIYDAKTHLSKLIERAEAGEEIVLARAGTPVAKLVPYTAPRRQPGGWDGRVRIAEDFDDEHVEIAEAFHGNEA